MKRAVICITPEFLGMMCKPMEKTKLAIESPIPEDAVFLAAEYSFERGCFMVVFKHDSFEDIKEGNRLPTLEPPMFKKYND